MNQNEDVPLFWSMSVMPNKQTVIKELCESERMAVLQITNACFGASVENDTRTFITVKSSDTNIPLCVLSEFHQNQTLHLLFRSVKPKKPIFLMTNGENVSPVYVTGYIQYLDNYYYNHVKLVGNQQKSEKKGDQMCYKCRAIKAFGLFGSDQTNKNKKICIQCA
eukprot:UN10560